MVNHFATAFLCGYIQLEDLSNIDMQMVNLKTIQPASDCR